MTVARSARTVLSAAGTEVRNGLADVNAWCGRNGVPCMGTEGKLIRPLVAWSGRPAGLVPDSRFWRAVGAIQMAHEASLIHDDILDGASERRGRSTVARLSGTKRALVLGDHLLTGSYRLAASTGSLRFAELFARAVERTVAGEVRQAQAVGNALARGEYEAIVLGKSGELLGCALATGGALSDAADADRLFETGRYLGLVYQMLDDLLDYLPGAASGKPPYQDYRNGHWTWPLEEVGVTDFGVPLDEVARRLLAAGPDGSALQRCRMRFEDRIGQLRRELRPLVDSPTLGALLDEWISLVRSAAAETERTSGEIALRARPLVPGSALPMPGFAHDARDDLSAGAAKAAIISRLGSERWTSALDRYARSFSFAARWFPARERARVADVYAICRFTDEIVDRDEGHSAPEIDEQLAAWTRLCRSAYDGVPSGAPFVDRAMGDARVSGVPFGYLEDLVAGMRMDLHGSSYATMADLESYTYRVASVVGLWLTRLFGVHDAEVLERAAALGRAMQLTNILRDVGEDLDRGRIYLPADVLARHGLDDSAVRALRAGGDVPPEWKAMIEDMMAVADRDYELAFEAIPDLPTFFQKPVAIAALVYRGIHEQIRRNGHDNLTRRARTSRWRKARLALEALLRLRSARARRARSAGRSRTGAQPDPAVADALPEGSGDGQRANATRSRVAGTAVGASIALALLAAPAPLRSQDSDTGPSPSGETTIEGLLERLSRQEAEIVRRPGDLEPVLERIGTLWLLGVDDEDAVKAGLATLDSIEAGYWSPAPEPAASARIDAYRGALRALQGKHAFWPHHKLSHVRAGLGLLDRAVSVAPSDARIRYLRLMSGYYLPGLFGRGNEVDDDFEALAVQLPTARQLFPPDLYVQIVGFVIENGDVSDDQRAVLQVALGKA